MHRMVELACSTLHVVQSPCDVQGDGVRHGCACTPMTLSGWPTVVRYLQACYERHL